MTERRLKISNGRPLPPEAVTETFAILAKRGSGKTYAGAVLAEEMVDAGAQVVILDPLDAWWGLRSSADGTASGVSIYVFGGEHGDLPLEATAGELLADVVVDHGISAIFSLRHLSKADQRRFVTAFAERLYHRKGEPEHRTPLHVFIDEADAFVPQRVMGDNAKMVGAIDDLVRRGRSSGIGVTLISQRAAVVNKDVLTQCEVLIALRTISPQDRKALDLWIEAHDAEGKAAIFASSLAGLDIGEAWVWSPGWLDIFERVKIRRRRTFDSSATPKAGAKAAQPKQRAAVDLAQLGERIQATRERVEANDPKRLKARITELERQVSGHKPVIEERVIEVPVPYIPASVNGALTDLLSVAGQLSQAAEGIERVVDLLQSAASETPPAQVPRRAESAPPPTEPLRRPASAGANGSAPAGAPATIGKAQRAFLAVLAQFPDGRTKRQAAVLAGYSPSVSTTKNNLSALRSAGLVTGMGSLSDLLRITVAGSQALDAAGVEVDDLPGAGPDLHTWWINRLPAAQGRFLRALIDAYPNSLSKEEAANRAGYDPNVSTTKNNLSALRSLGLIEGINPIRASEDLF